MINNSQVYVYTEDKYKPVIIPYGDISNAFAMNDGSNAVFVKDAIGTCISLTAVDEDGEVRVRVYIHYLNYSTKL